MQINFDEIKIPSEKLNQVVSENLETIKIHAQKRNDAVFIPLPLLPQYFLLHFLHFVYPTRCSPLKFL